MATGQIALSNTINVTLGKAPSGLGEYSTNSIVLLSNESPLSSEPYIWAVSAQDVINEYGSDSLTVLVMPPNSRVQRVANKTSKEVVF